ncbi:MAG: GNAT family N-acyltransferase [Pseudomonadota bacterium]
MQQKLNETERFATRLAVSEQDLHAAQRLRYQVFVEELGGDGPLVDHAQRREQDAFDEFADHLLLLDQARQSDDRVIGVYRLMNTSMAAQAGRFYCEGEYDLSKLRASGKRILELGRSCLHRDYRGGQAMWHLWQALGAYLQAHDIEIVFGVASFHGTDAAALAPALSFLHHEHLAPQGLRVVANGPTALRMNTLPADQIDRLAAVRMMPALIKAYLRLGAVVGDGAFVDHAFNTTDICILLERDAINGMQARIYGGLRD